MTQNLKDKDYVILLVLSLQYSVLSVKIGELSVDYNRLHEIAIDPDSDVQTVPEKSPLQFNFYEFFTDPSVYYFCL